jgi:cyclase
VKEGGASAVACGSLFVYQGKHRAVLTNYPTRAELTRLFP